MQLCLENFQFTDEDKIGTGGFGEVYKAKTVQVANLPQYVALKKVKRSVHHHKVERECKILKGLDHQNIVKFFDFFKGKDANYYIVMELCEHGDLRHYVKQHGTLSTVVSAKILKQIVCGLLYCHKNDILHRDLSAGNILIFQLPHNSSDPQDAPRVKITDFGLAKDLQKNGAAVTYAGTPGYMAREMMTGDVYGKGADVFALGSLLYYMLSGKEPTIPIELRDVPRDAADLIAELHADEVHRITLINVLKTPFFVENLGVNSIGVSVERRSRSREVHQMSVLSTGRRELSGNCQIGIEQGHLIRRPRNEISDGGSSRGRRSSKGYDSGINSNRSSSVPPEPADIRNKSVASGHIVQWPLDLKRLFVDQKGAKRKEMQHGQIRVIVDEQSVLYEKGDKNVVTQIVKIFVGRVQQLCFCKPLTGHRIPREGDPPVPCKVLSEHTRRDALTEAEYSLYERISFILWQMGHDVPRVTINGHCDFPWALCRLTQNGDVRILPNQNNLMREKYIRKKEGNRIVYKACPNDESSISRPIVDERLIEKIDNVYELLLDYEQVQLKSRQSFPVRISYGRQIDGIGSSVMTRTSSVISFTPASTLSAPSIMTRVRDQQPLRQIQPTARENPVVKQPRYLLKKLTSIDDKPFFGIVDTEDGRQLRQSSVEAGQYIFRLRNDAPEHRFNANGSVPRNAKDLLEALTNMLKNVKL